MKQSSIISVAVIIAFVLLTLFNIAVFAPTLHRQVPFNSWVWNHAHSPFGKVRYYMSKSLIEKLNQTQPTYQEAYELLGEDFWNTFDGGYWKEKCTNHELYYFLKSDSIIGFDHYYLFIEFDEQGNYKQAYITHKD